ncbi:AAA family ATPase [Ornithinimicrobium sp. INDO-MA30-4]|uniref:AAA family ATPase n=1 Tax=Ornithinimicrobium sp. INDO-MA30-4 TaxID=2908651 RepID=UPI0037CBA6A4
MKIHSVILANVKGVASRTVEFPDSGVVIVDGPNEVGKSTVIEALDLLLDPKRSRQAGPRTFRPCSRLVRTSGPTSKLK